MARRRSSSSSGSSGGSGISGGSGNITPSSPIAPPDDDGRSKRRNKLFRRIQMDIQDRERQRKKLGPVESVRYVDSQRNVAVEIGEKDIRREILKYRGKLKNSMLVDGADNMGFLLLQEQAERELKQNRPATALTYLDRAVSMHSDDPEIRLLRGRALLKAGKWKDAEVEAKLVMENPSEDQNNPAPYIVLAEALYGQGDFEHALVFFHRALKYDDILMGEKDEILAGIKKAEDALDNSVGSSADEFFKNAGQVLDKLPMNFLGVPWFQLKLILTDRFGREKKNPKSDKQRQSRAWNSTKTTSKTQRRPSKTLPRSRSAAGDREQDVQFLSELARDKKFFQNLVQKLETENAAKVVKEAEGALSFLTERREFWSQHKPAYEMSIGEKKSSSWGIPVAVTTEKSAK